jgi:hypothetical protein
MNSLFAKLCKLESAHQRQLNACLAQLCVRLEGNKPAVTPLAPLDINRVACPLDCLKSMANGLADPVAAFTQQIKEACSNHSALIGVSVEDFGSFAAALDYCKPQMPLVNFEDDNINAADIAFIPHPLSPYHTGKLSCVFWGENISGPTLMTTREFWTPSSSNPPTAHLIRRGCCVSSGGGI